MAEQSAECDSEIADLIICFYRLYGSLQLPVFADGRCSLVAKTPYSCRKSGGEEQEAEG